MINPPYSMGDKNNPSIYEINFIYHLLNSVLENGKVAAIVPQNTFTGKTSFEKSLKEQILKKHTLEGVITLNKYSGLFIAKAIKSNKYAFSRKAFSKRLQEQMILLPIDEKGEPNWEYMQKYIKQKFTLQAKQIIKYFK